MRMLWRRVPVETFFFSGSSSSCMDTFVFGQSPLGEKSKFNERNCGILNHNIDCPSSRHAQTVVYHKN